MKKLLFITYKLNIQGGVQRVMMNLIFEIYKDYDITILVLNGSHDSLYDLDPRIKTVVLDSFNTKSFRVMELMNKYCSWLPKKQNIKNYIYHYGVYCLLKKWLYKNHQEFDYIISTWYILSSTISIMKKEVREKTYAWEHISYKVGGLLFFRIMRPYYKNLRGIVCINKEAEEYYKSKKINTNTYFIFNLITDPFNKTSFIPLEEKENIILFAGRLHENKNVMELLQIVNKLEDMRGWKLLLVGDGEDRTTIEDYIVQNNLSESIFLEGKKTTEEVYEYMKRSKIFVLTSLVEGLPTVLIEAMFCSNVLISYDCEYGPANIINENNGFLVNMHDKKDFTGKLQLLIDNENLLEKLNKSSYQESKKWEKEIALEQWRNLLK